MGITLLAHPSPTRLLVALMAGLLVLVACDPLASPTLPAPLPTLRATPVPSPAVSPSPAGTLQPTPQPWPAGWDSAFCSAFDEVAIAQELVVDVPRAIEEEDNSDALRLARELRRTASAAEEQLGEVPGWEPAQPAISAMESLLDIGSRIGRQWIRFLDEGRNAGRTRAGELSEEMQPVVVQANQALADLAQQGLECPPHALILESP